MAGLKAHVVHLYPRWVLSRGNGTLICISRQPLSLFAPFLLQFAMILNYYKDFKTLKITGFGALAGRIQHMAAQKVGFTPRPIRYGSHNLQVSSSAALLHSRAELETCQLGGPYPGSVQKPYHFWPQITPSVSILIKRCGPGQDLQNFRYPLHFQAKHVGHGWRRFSLGST